MTRKTLFILFVVTLLVLSVSLSVVKFAVAQLYIDRTVSEAKDMIDANPSLVILDVSNQSEYDSGHIRNAKLIPVWNLTQNLDELDKADEILVYCKTGARSANASSTLASKGFSHVYNMLDGINGWISAGYPVYVNYNSPYASQQSVQAAIDNATIGQAIYVGTGFYNETLSIYKPVTLAGENPSTTIINASWNVLNVEADNVSISSLTIQYTGCACHGYSSVNVSNSQNLNITNNIIISDDFGIRVVQSVGAILAHNNLTRTDDTSIVVLNSSKVSVSENDVTGYNGMEMENCTDSSFSGNYIRVQGAGIFLADSFGDTFFDNNVSSDSLTGLSISTCYNNTFFDNEMSSPYGLFLWYSDNNSIFHNNFLGGGFGGVIDYNSTNFWDNGFEGNYWSWSNYTGVDVNINGIGDKPYVIDSTNRDNYPLMGLFYSLNTTVNSNVNIVSNSSIDDFEYLESNRTMMLRVSNTTENETVGFCRISIPHSLIDPYNGSMSVVIDNGQTPVLFLNSTLYDDGTSRWIYFTYQQSTHSVSISTVQEYPVFLVLALFMAVTITVSVVYKRRRMSV